MNLFARFPFLRFIIPFITGICLGIYFHFSVAVCCAFTLCFAVTLTVYVYSKTLRLNYGWHRIFGALLQLAWVSLGITLSTCNSDKNRDSYFENIPERKFLVVKLKEPLSKKSRSWKALGEVVAILNDNKTQKTTGFVLLYFSVDSNAASQLYCGDELLIPSCEQELEGPKNPGEFDYKHYLAYQNIFVQAYLKPDDFVKLRDGETFEMWRMVFRTRDALLSVLNKFIDDKTERGVAGALLFGYKDELDGEVVNAYARTGTLHVLAVSGMHVAILYVVVSFLFKPFQKKKAGAWASALVTIFLIWFYSLISGMSPSIVRASVMFTIIVAGKVLRDDISIYNNLFTSACLILCYNPYFLFDAGFQLSYLAVLGIVYFQPKIAHWVVFKAWISNQIWALITVSVAAQIATVPISLYYFNQFPNYFILSNIIIIPITTIIMYGGIVLLLICKITPLATGLGFIITKMIAFADYLIIKIQELPYAVTEGLYINKTETAGWYIFILLLALYLVKAKKQYLTVSLLVLFVLMLNLSIKKIMQSRQQVVVINSIRGAKSMNIINGFQNNLICDSSVCEPPQKLKMHFKTFWNSCGLGQAIITNRTQPMFGNRFIYQSNFLVTPGLIIYNVDENSSFIAAPKQKINYLLLRGKSKLTLEELATHFSFDKLILDASLSSYRRNKYLKEAAAMHLPYIDLLKDGAMVLGNF